MSTKTGIQWTDARWVPIRASVETGVDEIDPTRLVQPLRWRKPKRVHVACDLFHESLPDEDIDKVFAVMITAKWHTFQILTKRAERMRTYCGSPATTGRIAALLAKLVKDVANVVVRDSNVDDDLDGICISNVWLGVSVENQPTADARIPHLLTTPAALRFLSCEPLLGPIDFSNVWMVAKREPGTFEVCPGIRAPNYSARSGIDWCIIGGESGPKARPCNIDWIRSIVRQCRDAGVAPFVKQVGARPFISIEEHSRANWGTAIAEMQPDMPPDAVPLRLRDRKGGDPKEWPEDLRVRETPQ